MMYVIYSGLFVVCIAAAALFAASETALMSVSLSAWERMRKERPRMESAYALWSSNPSLMLASLLLCTDLASLGASVVAVGLANRLIEIHPVYPGAVLLLSSFLACAAILFLGEILPKLYARHACEKVLLASSGVLVAVSRSLSPVLGGLTALSEWMKKLFSFMPSEPLITAEELQQTISAPYVEGLAPSARRILSNLIAFDEAQVSEVMIPRNQIIAIPLEQNSERMFEHMVRSGFSRLPVYFGSVDNILGIVYARDLLVEWRSSGLLVLEDLLRPPYRIAPEAPLSVLLQGFRQGGHHLAVVTDSRGRTQGIVTIEDVVEAIVGDIADEFDQPR